MRTAVFYLLLIFSGVAFGVAPQVENNRLILSYGNVIDVGMDVNNAINFLEGNNYSCVFSPEKPDQVVFCQSHDDIDPAVTTEKYEINLIVEKGKITDFDVRIIDQ